MEGVFKTFFFLAFVVYSLVSVGIFLLVIKIILLFQPQVHLLGLIIS